MRRLKTSEKALKAAQAALRLALLHGASHAELSRLDVARKAASKQVALAFARANIRKLTPAEKLESAIFGRPKWGDIFHARKVRAGLKLPVSY